MRYQDEPEQHPDEAESEKKAALFFRQDRLQQEAAERRAQYQRRSESPTRLQRRAPPPLKLHETKANGLLELRAKASRDPNTIPASKEIRRKGSIKLPLPISISAPSLTAVQPRKAIKQAEDELEYKHRHTFIGTASLNDFLELLELTPEQTTTKDVVARAFTKLAAAEQIHARQQSTCCDGWEAVSRIDGTSDYRNYVAQAQIKLGSVTLAQFLELCSFGAEGRIGGLAVVEAFLVASHLDAKAGYGTGSKAKAFRHWMVQQ